MIRRIIGGYGAVIDVVDRVVLAITSLLLGVVVVLTGVEIIGRNVFKYSSPGSVDVTLSLAILVYFIGYLVLLNRDQDVMMDYFYLRFSPGVKRLLDAVTSVAILGFFIVLLLKSVKLFQMGMNSLHPVFPVPHGVVALPIVIAAIGCVLVAVRKTLDTGLVLIDGGRPAGDQPR